jgi:glycosyltransferase involved in cell wall biosynthesis
LKNLVLEKAKKYLSSDLVAKLDKIIQPHYLGVDKIDLSNNPTGNNIIFNHRDNEYTQYKWFLQQMDKLYERRQDFTVYTTLADINKPYGKRVKIHDRQDYLKFLKSMKVGVGCFSKYSAWSIATTDSLSMGVPYVLPNKLCYPEMVGEDYELLYDDAKDFLDKIEMMLDDKIEVDLSKKIKSFTWKKRVAEWFDKWKCFDEFDCVQETESYLKIKQFIIDNNSVSKKDILDYMGWGVRIGFNGYRNRLRTEPNITFTQNRYELKR